MQLLSFYYYIRYSLHSQRPSFSPHSPCVDALVCLAPRNCYFVQSFSPPFFLLLSSRAWKIFYWIIHNSDVAALMCCFSKRRERERLKMWGKRERKNSVSRPSYNIRQVESKSARLRFGPLMTIRKGKSRHGLLCFNRQGWRNLLCSWISVPHRAENSSLCFDIHVRSARLFWFVFHVVRAGCWCGCPFCFPPDVLLWLLHSTIQAVPFVCV